MNPGRSRALAGLCAALLPDVAVAQRSPPPSRPAWRWEVSGAFGLVSRGDEPWTAIYQALLGSGWDSDFPGGCSLFCPKAADLATGRPAAFGFALRHRFRRHFEWRVFGGTGPFGTFLGGEGGVPLVIRPFVTAGGVQGVFAFGSVWAGLGPSLNIARVDESAGAAARTSRSTQLGVAFAAGLTIPAPAGFVVAATVERRYPGSLLVPLMSVSGSSDVPPMRLPLSHTLLSVGIGWRR